MPTPQGGRRRDKRGRHRRRRARLYLAGVTVVGVVAHKVINNYSKEKVPKQDKKFIDINNV